MSVPRIVVNETLEIKRIAVTAEGQDITVTIAEAAAGVSTVNGQSDVVVLSTDDITEGVDNLYYTQARADARVAAGIAAIDFPVDSVNGATGAVVLTTSNIAEGTNLYYTQARADARVAAGIAAINYPVDSVNGQTNTVVLDTDDVAEGTTNQYFTTARARSSLSGSTGISYNSSTGAIAVDSTIATKTYADNAAAAAAAAIVDSAPATLDTLNELAAALGDDANFATTVTTALGTKLNTADFNSTFDTRLATKTTTNLAEGTNLYYTTARANTDFDTRLATKSTTNLAEGTNLYYSNARARQSISVSDAGGDGSLAYDNVNGVITYTGPGATEVRAHFSGGTGVTITDGVVAIGQAVGTSNSPTFAGVIGGNISVGVATDNTITTTNTNGNLVLAANGTGAIILSEVTRLQGEMQASTNLNYVFPPQTLNTVTDNNGYSAVSSFPAGTNGYGANMAYTHYFGDTLAGNGTTPALIMRTANGNSVTGDTVPFTGLTSVAPSATLSTETLSTFNFNGYGTTGFTNDIGTQNQGGGTQALHALQLQSYAAETFSDSVLTLTSANITAVASSFRAALGSPAVTGTKGQISFTSTTPFVGQAVLVSGTLTGTATGIVSGNTYYIIVTNGTTTATLSATPGGPPITTTAGTLTGLTLTRCSFTLTLSGQSNVPFGRGALVAVTGITNITDGTYPVWGTPTATSVSFGAGHTVAPTLSGTQTLSCRTTYMGSGYRIRTFPLATPGTQQNRVNLVDHTAAAATFRANTFNFNAGSYGTSGAGVTGDKLVYNRVYGQFAYSTTVTPVAANTAYVFPLGTADSSNIATVGSTSRLIPGAAGQYNLQFSVQVSNADNGSDHIAYIWLRKNGVDVVGSTGRATVPKGGAEIVGWNYLVSSANTTDYWELAYAVDSTQITFPFYAATAFAPSTATLITTITPVGA